MPVRGLKILMALPQLPQDPASGAARSMRSMCEILAAAGAEVRVVATTGSERGAGFGAREYLEGLGLRLVIEKTRKRPEWSFTERGVKYRLLDVGHRGPYQWQSLLGKEFDLLYDDALLGFQPDLLLTYGGLPDDRRRQERARRQGVRIVFALRNENYLAEPSFLQAMDAILTPSEFLSEYYRVGAGVESVALPVPLAMEDVVADEVDPIFFTMINPSLEKGLMVLARLAEELGTRRPDIPLLVVESRGAAGKLVQAGLAAGFDLRRHENIMTSPPMGQPKEIFTATRALLAPSLWQEAAGRVVAEALVNGIPPLVSDRGGLAETANGSGFVLPVPPDVTPHLQRPVDAEVVEPWLELMERLEGDAEFYAEESARAREAGKVYWPENLGPRYVDFFAGVAG